VQGIGTGKRETKKRKLSKRGGVLSIATTREKEESDEEKETKSELSVR